MRFDPPVELPSTFGSKDPEMYKDVAIDLSEMEFTAPIVNDGDILRIVGPMLPGEILSIELRIGHRLKDISIDDAHDLQIMHWDLGFLYWITTGRDGVL